ncbi:MAG TPA: VWA domain-containing protein [Vicinamibacterales bacterium]
MAALVANVLVFGRLLRALGLEVHVGRLLDVVGALQHVGLDRRDTVYHTCRALLVHRREDLTTFDRAFDAFWREHGRMLPRRRDPLEEREGVAENAPPKAAPTDAHTSDVVSLDAGSATGEGPGVLRTWSDADVLAHKDFGTFTGEEVAAARAALDRLEWTPGERRTRRWVPGRGPRLDLRRAIAESVRTSGDVLRWPMRRRRTRPRPVVVLCDISGSMERYSRMLLHFAHLFAARERRVEAFVFSTRLTRVTNELRTRGVNEALAHVASAVPDWSGGTRIGDALRQFHQHWSRRLPRGGLVVMLISDGWDRGDPLVLRDQMRRLRRRCHRLIWLNPLIGTPDYAPLTRGLQAALPSVDDFLPVRTLANLADLALHLNALAVRRRTQP